MLFNSTTFLLFGPVVVVLHWFLRGRQRTFLLLAASYVFYGAWDERFLLLIWLSTIVDYVVALEISKSQVGSRRRGRLLTVSLAVNLGVLGIFKYLGFFVAEASALLANVGLGTDQRVLAIALPVGISFYTFQTLAYTIDVSRGRLEPEHRLPEFALFVAYFPQLVAGPIERAEDLLPQLGNNHRSIGTNEVLSGLQLIVLGFFKKVALGDVLGGYADDAFAGAGSVATAIGVYAFAFQIYADFSGYSDIARGLSRLLGVELIRNFEQPYLSRSITEFWRRWHISLSNWLRDYLYIPLGGNRKGSRRTYINLMITMFLGGLWHGAGWTFVVWGLLNGLYLAVERLLSWGTNPSRPMVKADAIRLLTTFHAVCLTWIFFRADSWTSAIEVLQALGSSVGTVDLNAAVFTAFAGAALFAIDAMQRRTGTHAFTTALTPVPAAGIMALMLFLTLSATGTPPRQFIYFQF